MATKFPIYDHAAELILQSRLEMEAMLAAAGLAPLTDEPNQQQIDQLTAQQLRQAIKDQGGRVR